MDKGREEIRWNYAPNMLIRNKKNLKTNTVYGRFLAMEHMKFRNGNKSSNIELKI